MDYSIEYIILIIYIKSFPVRTSSSCHKRTNSSAFYYEVQILYRFPTEITCHRRRIPRPVCYSRAGTPEANSLPSPIDPSCLTLHPSSCQQSPCEQLTTFAAVFTNIYTHQYEYNFKKGVISLFDFILIFYFNQFYYFIFMP